VRSVDRVVTRMQRGRAAPLRCKGRVLKPARSSSGYPILNLGRRAQQFVHRLVLETFVGPRPAGHQAVHGDGDRYNNALTNLRWATRKENEADKRRHGTLLLGARNPAWTGARCGRGHTYTEANTRILPSGSRRCRECERDRQRCRRAAAVARLAAAALAPSPVIAAGRGTAERP
jgi:hypothetical protein